MDKQNLRIVLEECFKEVGNVAIFHFTDGSELMVDKKPNYFNLHMGIEVKYDMDNETIIEHVIVPYSSVLYITISNTNNLKILAKQFESMKDKNDVFFYDKLTENIE